MVAPHSSELRHYAHRAVTLQEDDARKPGICGKQLKKTARFLHS